MSLQALESTINGAFDARDGISTSTKGEVREDWELEGRDAGHVDHVTDDLTGFLQKLL